MDGNNRMQEKSGEYIWLRYATRFTKGGREHTVEMGVPVPLGASAGTRESLFREAEAGLTHLISHVESKLPQLLQNAQSAQHTQSSQNAQASQSSQQNRGAVSTPASSLKNPAVKPAPTKAASTSTAQTNTQSFPTNTRPVQEMANVEPAEDELEEKEAAARSGVSMPSMPGSGNGNLTLPEFIQAIKEMGLGPRDAMNLLKVKSLSTGINLREALERLHDLLSSQDGDEVSPREQKILREIRDIPRAPHQSGVYITQNGQEQGTLGQAARAIHNGPVPVFDEEVDPEDEEDAEFDEPLEQDPPALDEAGRTRARTLVNRLREARGPTQASAARIKALRNVIGDQLDDDQLQTLISGIWGVVSLQKLKVDQVEDLIYWAKEDDFLNDAEAVLTFLDEGE